MAKLCPPVNKALLDSGEVRLDGLVCPGHVSAIVGSQPYESLPRDYGLACVISGFEPLYVLLCIDMLIAQIESAEPKVEIAYRRGVNPQGNRRAQELMYQVFEVREARWRGIGAVPQSGLKLKRKYQRFDAERVFPVDPGASRDAKGCLCGDILRGVKRSTDCRLFRRVCTPESPRGPCMVSYEGTCSTYYLYGDGHDG